MKKNIFLILMLMMLALPLASCGDDEPKDVMTDGPEGEYTATITRMTSVSEIGEEYVWVSITSCPTSVFNKKDVQYPKEHHLLRIKQCSLQGREMIVGDEIHFKLLTFKKYVGMDSLIYMTSCWEGNIELI